MFVWLCILMFVVAMYAVVATVFAVRWNRERKASLACAAHWWHRWQKLVNKP